MVQLGGQITDAWLRCSLLRQMATASWHLAIKLNFLAYPACHSSRQLREGQGAQRRKSRHTYIDHIFVWLECDNIAWSNVTMCRVTFSVRMFVKVWHCSINRNMREYGKWWLRPHILNPCDRKGKNSDVSSLGALFESGSVHRIDRDFRGFPQSNTTVCFAQKLD